MSQTNVARRFTYAELLPLENYAFAASGMQPVNLPPSSTIPAGTLLLAPSFTGTSAVQTITAPGSLTYTLTGTNPVTGYVFTTAPIAYNANDAAVAAAINTVINGPGNYPSVPGGTAGAPATVTVSSLAVTFGGSLANYPVPLMTIASAGSGSPAVTNTTTGVTPGTATVYAGTSGTPVYITRYNTITDATGTIFWSSQTGGVTEGEGDVSTVCYTRGLFDASKLSILDSNAVTKLQGKFYSGSLTAGPGSTPAGSFYIG
jgi:hypothetical protein